METTKLVMGFLAIVIGLSLLPVVAGMLNEAKNDWNLTSWNGTAWVSDPAYREDPDMAVVNPVVNLILYGFCFSLVGVGIGMIYVSVRND